MSPGTGGTSATLGRYLRYQKHDTELLAVDPEHSVFYDYFKTGDATLTLDQGSKIEGIGRPRVEPSFIPGVVDEMLKVPDAASIATMHWLSDKLGRKVGPSSGTNMWGVLNKVSFMSEHAQKGAIVSLICDSGERYTNTYHNAQWVKENIGDYSEYVEFLKAYK